MTARPMASAPAAPASRPDHAAPSTDRGAAASLRVLVVDDAPEVQSALRALLRAEPGVEVVGCASDGSGAQALADGRAPDLVVLDVALAGGERGYDVLRQLRAAHPRLEVIMLSNFGWASMRSPFLDAGAAAYFDKALQFDAAIAWIRARADAR